MNISQRFHHNILDRLQPSSQTVLLGSAILVGAGTGIGAILFIRLIEFIHWLFFSAGAQLFSGAGRLLLILIPMIGGLLAGPVIAFFAKEAKGHGVPEVMAAIALHGGRIRPRVVVGKIIASALCIGSGGSAGREGPIVQVGAALGSTLGQWLHLSRDRIRNLVACGAAAGIAATFNAPIAGVIFSMEIILGEFHLGMLGNVVISAVTASTLARVFLGERPAFSIPRYGMQTPWEIFLYALLGILAALAAVGFIRLLTWFEDRFDEWHKFPDAMKPALGGLLLGLLGFAYPLLLVQTGSVEAAQAPVGTPVSAYLPHIFGSGFPFLEDALIGKFPFLLLFALVLLKPLATSLTLGSGNSGGVFAPALFIGAALGGSFGELVDRLLPGATAGAGAFATVGMAAVFAGAARAPFTAILIVFEMTDDYRLIVPLMAAVIVSLLVAENLHKESIYTIKLVRRGIRIEQGHDLDVMDSVKVSEVMITDVNPVTEDLPVALLAGEFLRTGRHGFPVIDKDGRLSGVVSLRDYRLILDHAPDQAGQLTVADIASRTLTTVFSDETVGAALRKMAPRDISRLPVVSRADPRQLIGLVRRNDIVRAYEFGVVRREEARRRARAATELSDTRAVFMDIHLTAHTPVIGLSVAELDLPRDAVLVSIRRGQELVIPHGDTILQAGDVVTVLCERGCCPATQKALGVLEAQP